MQIQTSLRPMLILLLIVAISHIVPCLGFYTEPDNLTSGTLKLIIGNYINELLSNHPIQDENVKRQLHQLSGHVSNHPALGQTHFYVGSSLPNHNPHSIYKRLQASEPIELPVRELPSEEICTTNRKWEQINTTHDIEDNKVEVIQEGELTQFVYTYRCSDTKASSCVGISPLYHSECAERHGWVYMLYRKVDDPEGKRQWGYVAAPHHCACKIQPKAATLKRFSQLESFTKSSGK